MKLLETAKTKQVQLRRKFGRLSAAHWAGVQRVELSDSTTLLHLTASVRQSGLPDHSTAAAPYRPGYRTTAQLPRRICTPLTRYRPAQLGTPRRYRRQDRPSATVGADCAAVGARAGGTCGRQPPPDRRTRPAAPPPTSGVPGGERDGSLTPVPPPPGRVTC